MVVQNYAHNREHDSVCPRKGIDAFVDVYGPLHINVLSPTFHFFIEKKKTSAKSGSNANANAKANAKTNAKAKTGSNAKACHIEGYPVPKNEWPICNIKSRNPKN